MKPMVTAAKTRTPKEIGTPMFSLGMGVSVATREGIGLALGMLHRSIMLVSYAISTTS